MKHEQAALTKKEEIRIAGDQKEIHQDKKKVNNKNNKKKHKKRNAKLNSALETVKSRL